MVNVPLLTVGSDDDVMNPESFTRSLVLTGTVMLAVALELWFAVKVATFVPFFWIVKVPSFTVLIVGLSLRSLYEPEKATVDKAPFNLLTNPVIVVIIPSRFTPFELYDLS